MAYKNIEDQRAASKRHYYANKQQYLERKKIYKNKLRALVRGIKESSPCVDCGIQYPYYVMDFDHLENKEGMISYFAKTGRSGALKKELSKCEVVCANCHRIRSFERS